MVTKETIGALCVAANMQQFCIAAEAVLRKMERTRNVAFSLRRIVPHAVVKVARKPMMDIRSLKSKKRVFSSKSTFSYLHGGIAQEFVFVTSKRLAKQYVR